jgi:phenylalanyl-tRNA synthetase beta chain
LSEAWISSLVSLEDLSGRGTFAADASKTVAVLNPLSEEHQALRTSLIPGLLKAVAHNQDRGRQDVWLYEIGLVYNKLGNTGDKAPKEHGHTGCHEEPRVAAIVCGHESLSLWHERNGTEKEDAGSGDFYLLKGVVENLFARLSIDARTTSFAAAETAPDWFHPARTAHVYARQGKNPKVEPILLGHLGEIHPAVLDAYGLKHPGCIFELSLDSISKISSSRQFQEIFNTPQVSRDLSCDVDKAIPHAAAFETILKAGGQLLREVELVSVFRLSDSHKSLTYRLTFQKSEATLTADEVESLMSRVRDELKSKLSATFRT